MNAMEQAEAYFNAWNEHDSTAIAGLFVEGGRYSDPNVPEGVAGEHLSAYAASLFAAFSDLTFETVNKFENGNGAMIAEWLMKGTHDGELRGLAPTGRAIAVPGIDVIEVAPDGIESVRGYFSNGAMMEQLDCQIVIQPKRVGPTRFGTSTYTSIGNKAKPGVVGITQIEVSSAEESDAMAVHMQAIRQEFAAMRGYISSSTMFSADGHGVTLTAWEDLASAEAAVQSPAHMAAVRDLFKPGGIGDSAWTSMWTEGQMNLLMQRCAECGVMAMVPPDNKCKCGAALPEPAAYL